MMRPFSITLIFLVGLASKVCASGYIRATTYCIRVDNKAVCPGDSPSAILESFSIDSGFVVNSKILPELKPKWRDYFDLKGSIGNLIFAADYCVYRNKMGHDNLVGCAQDCYPVIADYIPNPWHEKNYGDINPDWTHMKSGQTNRYLPTIIDNCADPQPPPSSIRSGVGNGINVALNDVEPVAEGSDETLGPITPADPAKQYLQQSGKGVEFPVATLEDTTTVPNMPGRLDFASDANVPSDFTVSEAPTAYDISGNQFSASSTKDIGSGDVALLDTSDEFAPDSRNVFTTKRATKNARDFRLRAFKAEY